MATVTTTGERVGRGRGLTRPGLGGRQVLPWLLVLVLALLVLYPLSMVVYSSFRDTPPGAPGALTLDAWRQTMSNPDTFSALATTLRIVIPKVLLAISVAALFAWIVARTNAHLTRVLEAMLAFMFFLPSLPWVLSWVLLISPRSGFLNQWLAPFLPGGFRFNAFSYEALVILGAMHSVPILFILLLPAFRNMDPMLEESAQVSGAGRWTTLRRVTLPLLAPALLATAALSTVVGMESFEAEQLLGTPAGIFVFTTRIYDYLYYRERSEFGPASALSLVLLAITVGLLLGQRRLLAGRSFTTITGKGYRPRQMDLGGARWLATGVVGAYVLVFGMLPFVILLLTSFMQVSGFLGMELVTNRNWTKIFASPQLITSIQNTVLVGVLSATVGVVLASLAAYLITRLRWKGRAWVDVLVWLPIAVPGLVLALGFLWAFIRLPIYGTLWILVLAYVIRGLPTSSRFFTSTMVQVGTELEEAARVHGVGWLTTFYHVWRPLLMPAVISAWVYLFVISVRILDSALLLTGPSTEVLSVSIFQQASRGDNAVASALALVQTGIITLAYLATRLVSRRGRPAADVPIAQ